MNKHPGSQQQQPRSPEDHARTMLRMDQLSGTIERSRDECFGAGAELPQVAEVIHAYFKLRGDTQEERLPEPEVARLGRQMQVPPNHADIIRKVYSLVRLENEASACEEDHLDQLGAERMTSGRKAPGSARSMPGSGRSMPGSVSRRRQPVASPNRVSKSSRSAMKAPASVDRARAAYTRGPKPPRPEPAAKQAEALLRNERSSASKQEEARHRRNRDEDVRQAKLEEAQARRDQREAERRLEAAAARRAKTEDHQVVKEEALAQFEQMERQVAAGTSRSRSPLLARPCSATRPGSAPRMKKGGGSPKARVTSPSPAKARRAVSPAAAAAAEQQARDEAQWAYAKQVAMTKRKRREQQALEEEAARLAAQVPVVSPAFHQNGNGNGPDRANSPNGRAPGSFMGPRSRSPTRVHSIGEERVALLFRDHGKLGISFNGPVRGPATVTNFGVESVAAKSRSLKIGMVLSEVAGVSVEGLAFSEALDRLQQSGRPLALCFRQPTDKEVRGHQEHELRQEAAAIQLAETASPLQSSGVSGVMSRRDVTMSPAEISAIIDSALDETGVDHPESERHVAAPASTAELTRVFGAFAAWGLRCAKGSESSSASSPRAGPNFLSATQFAKLCRDTGIVEDWTSAHGGGEGVGTVSRTDVDLVFSRLVSKSRGTPGAKNKQAGLTFPQFEGALEILSLRRFSHLDPEAAYAQITGLVVRSPHPEPSPSPRGRSGSPAAEAEAAAGSPEKYGFDNTPSKYDTPREIPDLDEGEEEQEEDNEDEDNEESQSPPTQQQLLTRLEVEFGDAEQEGEAAQYYDDDGGDGDENQEEDWREQTTYEDASEPPQRNVAQISREILDSIFRAIGDAMRHHRTVFNHDLTTTHSAFSAFDRDRSGEINYDEFEAAMRRLDIPLSDEQLRQIFDTFDANGNETIEYGEFAKELHMAGIDNEDDQDQEEDIAPASSSASKITYEIDDDEEDDDYMDDAGTAHGQDDLEESFGNLAMGVIVEEPMEEIEEITPRSPAGSPGARAANISNASSGSAHGSIPQQAAGGGGDSSVLRDTEADLQYFVEEWRALDTDQANALSLKELAVLLQRLPVPMGVGEGGGVEELGELMTQLLASQEVPVVNGNVGGYTSHPIPITT